MWIDHFRIPKTVSFKMRSSAQPLLWKALNLVLIFAFLKTRRKLGGVTFRKDVWDRYWGRAIQLLANRPLPSSKNPHFQNEAKCTTFLVEMSFVCMRLSTSPRFDTEARGNSEVAYLFSLSPVTGPEVFAKINSAQFPSRFVRVKCISWRLSIEKG